MSEVEETNESVLGDQEFTDTVESEIKEDARPIVTMQPFFGPDKKYGACPFCAAVIVAKNEDTTKTCSNCKAELRLN